MSQLDSSVLLFNKPYRWTSFDLVNKVSILLKVKTGHAGTLDPLATGLLILCTGKMTKQIDSFQPLEKEYTGTFTFGATTPSFDRETEVDQCFDFSHITNEKLLASAGTFIGTKEQMPPVHSAKHHKGKRYYEFAREGKEFSPKRHLVSLYSFELTRIELPEVDFKIVCGKGFYVRSLANDFGKALDSGAYLTSLCRTRIGEFKLEDAWQIDQFAKFVDDQKENAGTQKP